MPTRPAHGNGKPLTKSSRPSAKKHLERTHVSHPRLSLLLFPHGVCSGGITAEVNGDAPGALLCAQPGCGHTLLPSNVSALRYGAGAAMHSQTAHCTTAARCLCPQGADRAQLHSKTPKPRAPGCLRQRASAVLCQSLQLNGNGPMGHLDYAVLVFSGWKAFRPTS